MLDIQESVFIHRCASKEEMHIFIHSSARGWTTGHVQLTGFTIRPHPEIRDVTSEGTPVRFYLLHANYKCQ
ncbi:hypothetical protein AcV5_000361 [Taiwanofungus camphoratus]|nr:hypothetical protein AcV7_003553 [Antrodia cinnamomea]KAI0938752.1 hypothetical protein AcV5_000361 [Antrodia cinnamomea]